MDETDVYELTNRLVSVSSQRHSTRRGQANPPEGYIFHYTTAAGLQGIVESNCLHASGAYFLNDYSELEYGRKILADVFDQWELDNPEAAQDLTAELVYDLRERITDEKGREALVHSVYLACFCQRDNVLSQWRTYGQAGGYSVGFPVVLGAIRGVGPESPSYTSLLTRVEYRREKQIEACKEILNLILPVADDRAMQRFGRTINVPTYHGPTTAYDFMLNVAQEMLVDEILSFKDKAFEEEDEWRLIVRPRKFLLHAEDDRGKTQTKIYFRPHRGLVVPFLKLHPMVEGKPGGKLPIARITSGPSIDQGRASASVRLLLTQYGFPDADIRGSQITVAPG